VAGPKKRALAAGFARARGEVLMTTDADCLPPPSWIRALASGFDEGVGIVQGPKRIRPGPGLLGRYQEVEVFGLVSIEAASFALGKPLLASAPSLAYRRSLYDAAGGFDGIEHSASGDDDLLVRKMLRRNGFQVRYLADPEACVETGGVQSWIALLLQRARWASNGARYEEKGYVATLAGLYLFYAWLLLAPVAASLSWISWDSAFFLWGVKIGLNGAFLGLTAPVLRFQGLWRDHAWCEILHVPIVLLAVPLGHFGWFRWK
jgi:cellulose synthase/poly-beta-1,6-N-acetylglucosamine synthase-like glycosyltransferase